ncbi:MAG: glutathione S-transferase N-terminal domain-containing protein [Woeseia sp.]|nr:glutathione S-transferase N-terminal domain-containing protein [Woeseia sp.]
MSKEMERDIAELLRQTAIDFREGRIGDDIEGPDWPIGYAEVLKLPFAERFGLEFSKVQLIQCLLRADNEYEARSPESDWADYYAGYIVECHSASDSPANDRLALYYFPTCPFCRKVLAAMKQLDVDIELRNIQENEQYRDELIAARGRPTVPVLKIESPDGGARWMPESRDIIRYLEKNYS